MKPMPVTTPAATLDGSTVPLNPITETTVKRAEPMQINM
jgi:hypothetical protein